MVVEGVTVVRLEDEQMTVILYGAMCCAVFGAASTVLLIGSRG